MADASTTKTIAPSKRTSPPEATATPNTAAGLDETPGSAAAAAVPAPEPGPPAPEPGWFRNTAATPLTVLPDQYPSARLAPGEATWLPDDPHHPDLRRCDEPTPAEGADDTTRSEK
jgi:hypothetical protein